MHLLIGKMGNTLHLVLNETCAQKFKFILTKNLQPVVGSAIQMYNHPPPVMILMIGNKFLATKNHCLCLGVFLLA